MRHTAPWLVMFLGMATIHAQVGGRESGLPTVDLILARSATALGGEIAAAKLTSVHMTGSLEVVNIGMKGNAEVVAKAPDKRYVQWVLPGAGSMRSACNGRQGWSESLLGGRVQVEGERLAGMKRRAQLLQAFRLKEQYAQLTLQGRRWLGDRECWVILADPPDGRQETWYFEVSSGLPRRIDCHAEDGLPLEIELEDYRAVEGAQFPFLVRQFTPVYHIVMRFSSIRANLPVDDGLFEKP